MYLRKGYIKKKYHTVGTVPKPTEKSQKPAKSIPLEHTYMAAHLPRTHIHGCSPSQNTHTRLLTFLEHTYMVAHLPRTHIHGCSPSQNTHTRLLTFLEHTYMAAHLPRTHIHGCSPSQNTHTWLLTFLVWYMHFNRYGQAKVVLLAKNSPLGEY